MTIAQMKQNREEWRARIWGQALDAVDVAVIEYVKANPDTVGIEIGRALRKRFNPFVIAVKLPALVRRDYLSEVHGGYTVKTAE